jgi:hypothetical protein
VFRLALDGTRPEFGAANLRIEEGSDLDVDMTFEPALDIAGKVECECADGWKDAIAGARINVGPPRVVRGRSISAPADPIREPERSGQAANQPDVVDAQNTFRIVGSFAGALQLAVEPMPRGMRIKEARYNGSAGGNTFVPDPHATGQVLTIRLTDKPAHLTGTVYRDGNRQHGAHVAIAPWPLSMIDDFPEYEAIESDQNGEFATELAAGTYRVISVDQAGWASAEMPDVLARWFASGKELVLADGERKALSIELMAQE